MAVNSCVAQEKAYEKVVSGLIEQAVTYEIFKEYVNLKNNEINVPKKAPLFEYAMLYEELFDRYAKVMCLANKVVLYGLLSQEESESMNRIASFCLKESKKVQKAIEAIEKTMENVISKNTILQ